MLGTISEGGTFGELALLEERGLRQARPLCLLTDEKGLPSLPSTIKMDLPPSLYRLKGVSLPPFEDFPPSLGVFLVFRCSRYSTITHIHPLSAARRTSNSYCGHV